MIYILLLAIYIIGICNIMGSINPYYKKQGSGKIKQALLDYGYKHLGVLQTNLLGLWLSGTLQCLFLCIASPYLVLFGLGMPLCYWAAVTFTGDTKWAEYSWGFMFGVGIMVGYV